MNLESIVNAIFSENEKRSENGLQSDRNVQGHFSKSYKSRFFLELLQNARDAIVQANQQEGKVHAWLKDNVLYFANNGANFNEEGVNGICYPAISYKKGMELVGHKGIGFNAVLEISDCPEIITRFGTFYFNYSETAKRIGKEPDKIPLFQFPHYKQETIQDAFPDLSSEGFTTVVKLPLTKKHKEEEIRQQTRNVSGQDLIFLEAITELNIEGEIKRIDRDVDKITLTEGKRTAYYNLYHHHITFTPDAIAGFDEDEQEHFVTHPSAECKFLLQTDKHGKFVPAGNAPLFLYYGLDIKSGFPFFIHSYFSVTLDRKRLADNSPLNEELLKQIAEYYAGDFLKKVITDFPKKELRVLAYNPKANANLEFLYQLIPQALKDKKFIYHPQTDQYLAPSQLLLVSEKIMQLFSDGVLGEKYLLHVQDSDIYDWLNKELKIGYIKNEHITPFIEVKCAENVNNPKFFELLYDVIAERNLDLKRKKVLLTEHAQLVSGAETELYYQRKESYTVPAELDNSLAFLHKEIKVDDLRESSKRLLGLKEYSEENLYRAALRVFDQYSPKKDAKNNTIAIRIIQFLKSMNITKEDSLAEIADRIPLPVIHKSTQQQGWKEPLTTPIYFDDFSFAAEYNQDYFCIDLSQLATDQDTEGWHLFLSNLGVWNIPGAFLNPDSATITSSENSHVIANDRIIHEPTQEITASFGNTIINNWTRYREFIISENRSSKAVRVNNKKFVDREKIRHVSLYRFLSGNKWIAATFQGGQVLCQPQQVIGMTAIEAGKNHNQIIAQFLPVVKIDTHLHRDFITDFAIIHASGENIANYKRLLKLVYSKYRDLKISDKSGFEKFFNRILTFIHDYLQSLDENQRNKQRDELREEYFLAKSIVDGSLYWSVGNRTIHIDDKAFLDGLEYGIISLIRDPYAFTKRDRNEWGKIGAKIGRPLSGIIKTSVISEGTACKLVKKVDCMEVMIGFVEDDLERHLTEEQIELLTSVDLIIHDELRLTVEMEGTVAELKQPFYVAKVNGKSILHMDRQSLNDPYSKNKSKALADFFEQFTDSEIKRFDVIIDDILKLSGKQAKYEYAISRNIDETRLDAIRIILTEGIGVENDNEIPEEISAPITPGTQVIVTTTTTSPPATQTVVTLKSSLQDYLVVLDAASGDPINLFSGNGAFSANGGGSGKGGGGFGYGGGMELNEPSQKMIGILAEYYVYKRILEGHQDMLAHLGCTPLQAEQVKWYNKPRLKNLDLKDQSIGKGCDMVIEGPGIHIEVKGMLRNSTILSVTGPEFDKMREVGENYYLVIVSNLFEEGTRAITVIKNPYVQVSKGIIKLSEAKLFTP